VDLYGLVIHRRREAMAKCPQCGLEWGGEEAAADASAGRPRTTVTDPGGCLLTVLLLAGLAVVLPGAVWLGSLAGFDLWHWMVTYGTSVTTVARVILVFSLAVLLVVLVVRRPIGRHGGPKVVCRDCGYRAPAAAAGAPMGVRIGLGALLVVIFACLGLCSFGYGPFSPASASACAFSASLDKSCKSDDHQVTVRSPIGAPSCHFTETVSWGDGSKKTSLTLKGDAATPARHTYAKPGTYPIVVSSKTTAGACKFPAESYTFTYAP
jgi:predicted RNA-binding Zn-ribbon protein involved in translation (DUF1610 family)